MLILQSLLPENLTEICERVATEEADLGLVVDPDADRLALIADGGVYVSEELTQVLAADFWWQHHSGPFATNLSSSRAIERVAAKHGQDVFRSAVGEINVVEEMKRVGAAIGGEGQWRRYSSRSALWTGCTRWCRLDSAALSRLGIDAL